MNGSGYVLGTRTDSVQLIGSDSLFFSYRSLRVDADAGEGYFDKNWYGTEVLIKDDGWNVFYNEFDEEITLKTNAVLEDTFLVYTYPSGDWIKGWVSAHDTMRIFGDLDSVKTISLFSNISMEIDFDHFVLSKHHGFVNLFPFYSFPAAYNGVYLGGAHTYPDDLDSLTLVGRTFPEAGILNPTVNQVFDFEIGDEIKYTHESDGTDYGSSFWDHSVSEYAKEKGIIGVSSPHPDTLVIDYSLKTRHKGYSNVYPMPTSYWDNVNTSTETDIYWDLESYYFELLPEEINYETNEHNFSILYLNDCDRLEIMISDELFHIVEGDTISYASLDPQMTRYFAVVGLGEFPVQGSSEFLALVTTYTSALVYYNKIGEDECGSNFFVSNEGIGEKIALTVYPNPAQNILNIETTVALNKIEIRNLAGQLVYNSNKEIGIIDVSFLERGSYVLTVYSEDNRENIKFSKL